MSTTISNERVIELVDLVLDGKFKLNVLYKGDKTINKVVKNQELVEPTKEFKGILTEFIINELIKTPDQNSNFLKLVCDTFKSALNTYITKKQLPLRSVIFLYKGGNILRLIFQDVSRELPYSVSRVIEQYWKDSFKKSDADFSIYIDPRLPNFDEVYENVCNLTFLLENQIRNVFMQNLSYYFEYFKLNDDTKKQILNNYLQKLNDSMTVKEKKFDFDGKFTGIIFGNISVGTDESYVPKEDFQIAYIDRKTQEKNFLVKLNYLNNIISTDPTLSKLINEQKSVYDNKANSDMFISSNEISFQSAKYRPFFNLIRTKWAINGIFDKNENINEELTKDIELLGGGKKMIKLDGELIDITVIHKEDTDVLHFFEHLNENISTYKIETGLEFEAYSILYLIADLEKILFNGSEFPWEAIKYDKRIKRLLFMYFLILLLNFKATNRDSDERIKYITSIHKIFDFLALNKHIEAARLLIDNLKTLPNQVKKNPTKELLKNLANMLPKSNIDKGEFIKYIAIVNENLAKIIEIINLLHDYIDNGGSITEEQILTSETISGGSDFIKSILKI
jgi:hypothetical protein